MGKTNNLDIPIMRAVGENSSKKLYSSSSGSMQKPEQSDASGYKRGGHVGKHRSKPKIKIAMVAPDATAVPPSPDPSMAAAGAGSSPVPAPMPPPGPPPIAKRGGRFASGGRAYPKHGGAESGSGRLALSKAQARKK